MQDTWAVTAPVTRSDDEWGLIEAARADPPAFAPLYYRYRGRLYAYVRSRVGNDDDAADLSIAGPFDFDMTVPFNGATLIAAHDVARAGPATLTVTRLETTPLDTRVYVSTVGLPGAGLGSRLFPAGPGIDARAVYGGASYEPIGGQSSCWCRTNKVDYVFDVAHPYGFHGPWTLDLRLITCTVYLRGAPPVTHSAPLAHFRLSLP